MNTKKSTERSLHAESLEGRAMMAGDIAASVQGGILYLRGDEAANGVMIRNAADGKLEVVGTVAGNKATFDVVMPKGAPFKFSLTIVKGRLQGDMTRDQNGTIREAKVDAAKVAPEKK